MKRYQKIAINTLILIALLCSNSVVAYSDFQPFSKIIEKCTHSNNDEITTVLDIDQLDEQVDLLLENDVSKNLVYTLINTQLNFIIDNSAVIIWLPPKI